MRESSRSNAIAKHWYEEENKRQNRKKKKAHTSATPGIGQAAFTSIHCG